MIILIGASASGKTTIAKYLTTNLGFKKFVTSTTRLPRKGEINSIDYNFITIDTFNKKKENNEFIETTFYNENYYGTEKKLISDDTVLIVEFSGLKEFKKMKDPHIISYFLNCNEETRIKRMTDRGDAKEQIEKRLNHDKYKFKADDYASLIDVVIDTSSDDIKKIANDIASDYKNKIK